MGVIQAFVVWDDDHGIQAQAVQGHDLEDGKL